MGFSVILTSSVCVSGVGCTMVLYRLVASLTGWLLDVKDCFNVVPTITVFRTGQAGAVQELASVLM